MRHICQESVHEKGIVRRSFCLSLHLRRLGATSVHHLHLQIDRCDYGFGNHFGTFPQVILVDDFQVGGLLNPDMTTFIPEPTSLLALSAVAMIGLMRRGRA